MTKDIISGAISEAWKDFVSVTCLFVSFCGLTNSSINFINAVKPGSLKGLSFKPEEKKA